MTDIKYHQVGQFDGHVVSLLNSNVVLTQCNFTTVWVHKLILFLCKIIVLQIRKDVSFVKSLHYSSGPHRLFIHAIRWNNSLFYDMKYARALVPSCVSGIFWILISTDSNSYVYTINIFSNWIGPLTVITSTYEWRNQWRINEMH